jgi:hypothetical protein
MLIYHPSLDIYHTAFRILKILTDNPLKSFEKERIRIFDFLVLFPHELKNVTCPSNLDTSWKTFFRETEYNKLPDRKVIFKQIQSFHEGSLQCLVTRNLIEIDLYKSGMLKSNGFFLKSIQENFEQDKSIEPLILDILYTNFLEMPLKELKERTKLIEYRYDIPKN